MALTQSATSWVPGPSWDETIVPTLRKRLESESRTLARRMSAVSITSTDERPSSSKVKTSTQETRPSQPPSHFSNGQPASQSALQPRTSSERPRDNIPRVNGFSSSSSTSKTHSLPRSRTYSQPYSADPVATSFNGKGSNGRSKAERSQASPESNRSISPSLAYSSKATEPKPTRIPKPRTRTTSASSHGPGQYLNLNGYNHPPLVRPSKDNPDLYPVHESNQPYARSETSSISVPSRQNSGLLNEQPPFKASSISSSRYDASREAVDVDGPPTRASTDSEERPFEHWYRGDLSRNGGVGELRVGKRMEMLDIANYGYSLRKKAIPIPHPTNSTGISISDVNDLGPRSRRKRADSVSGILGDGRESVYLDEERAREIARVLDENPLTDLDADPEDDDQNYGGYTAMEENVARYRCESPVGFPEHDDAGDVTVMSAPTPTINQEEFRSVTPMGITRLPMRQQSASPTRIPTPSGIRQSSETARVPVLRGASELPSLPPSTSKTPSTPSTPRSRTQQSSTPKGRGRSPLDVDPREKKPPSASAKARALALATKQKAEDENNRRSVAQYPNPGEGELADAIPTWTQPVLKTGNWDEVVLPVVARKKGLDDQYEQVDGTPKPKRPESIIAPAPGTFGYDHSKYRHPRGEAIPMDEFGGLENQLKDDQIKQMPRTDHERPMSREKRMLINPPAPPPFSQYAATPTMTQAVGTTSTSEVKTQLGPVQDKDDAGGGCCKCVIM